MSAKLALLNIERDRVVVDFQFQSVDIENSHQIGMRNISEC